MRGADLRRFEVEDTGPRGAHAGFSLIMVLIVAVVGMALAGASFYIYEAASGRAAVSMGRAEEYNVLQSAIEDTKSRLAAAASDDTPVPQGTAVSNDTSINGPDDLLVEELTSDPRDVDVNGRRGKLKVEVFDITYEDTKVTTPMSAANQARMPAAARHAFHSDGFEINPFAGGQLGAYLIRATLTLDGEEKVMETSLFQRNSADITVSGIADTMEAVDPDGTNVQ